MTDAVKRKLLAADRNFGGKWVVGYGYGIRGINTVCAMVDNGLAERHPQFGPILTPKGEKARERLLGEPAE